MQCGSHKKYESSKYSRRRRHPQNLAQVGLHAWLAVSRGRLTKREDESYISSWRKNEFKVERPSLTAIRESYNIILSITICLLLEGSPCNYHIHKLDADDFGRPEQCTVHSKTYNTFIFHRIIYCWAYNALYRNTNQR